MATSTSGNLSALNLLVNLKLDFLSVRSTHDRSHTYQLMQSLEKVAMKKLKVDSTALAGTLKFESIEEVEILHCGVDKHVIIPNVKKVVVIDHDVIIPENIDFTLADKQEQMIMRGGAKGSRLYEFCSDWRSLSDQEFEKNLRQYVDSKKKVHPKLFEAFDYSFSYNKKDGYQLTFTKKTA